MVTDGTRGFDVDRTYVRVVERRPDGFVEFCFSIGDPSLFVEMLLNEPAFAEFCQEHHAELIESVPPPAVPTEQDDEVEDWDWSLHDATHRRFR